MITNTWDYFRLENRLLFICTRGYFEKLSFCAGGDVKINSTKWMPVKISMPTWHVSTCRGHCSLHTNCLPSQRMMSPQKAQDNTKTISAQSKKAIKSIKKKGLRDLTKEHHPFSTRYTSDKTKSQKKAKRKIYQKIPCNAKDSPKSILSPVKKGRNDRNCPISWPFTSFHDAILLLRPMHRGHRDCFRPFFRPRRRHRETWRCQQQREAFWP